ncbi:ALF repeat-containing protein [Streptomyces chrestomyceticus]
MHRRRLLSESTGSEAPVRTAGRARRSFSGVVLSVALAAGLLGAAPASAQDDPEDFPLAPDRALAVSAWRLGGSGIRQAAEQALVGTDDDIRKFLDEAPAIQYDDDYIDASRIFNTGGPAVREATKTALRGTPGELREYLRGGWQKPLEEDR